MVESEEEENSSLLQVANRDNTLPVCPFSVRTHLRGSEYTRALTTVGVN